MSEFDTRLRVNKNEDKYLRRHARFHLMGSLPFQFVAHSGEMVVTVPVDLCAKGIGLIFDRSFDVGSQITLQGSENYIPPVNLRVVWIYPLSRDDSMTIYRAGLEVTNDVNLESLCRKYPSIQLEDM